MKKALSLFAALAFIFTMAAPVYATDLPAPVEKLADGTMDIVSSPLEIINHTKSEMDSADNMPFGLLKGLIESPFYVVKKAGSGVVSILTFPIE